MENLTTQEFENQDVSETNTQETSTENTLSKRELAMAYQKALKERKEKIKENKQMIEDMNLEVSYWKAKSDLLKYRFEKMDYYLKNIELEPKYLMALEAKKAQEAQSLVENQPTTLS